MKQKNLDYVRPFFLGEKAGPQRYRYILWIDLMGAGPKIGRNVRAASIPLIKLHVAALTAAKQNKGKPLELFPIIDGLYVAAEDSGTLMFFMSHVLRTMAAEFLMVENKERSIVRGAVSYGPVILGRESKEGAEILKESDYCHQILLGMPLLQAYVAERLAPPFGIYIRESARAFAPTDAEPFRTIFWRWWLIDKVALQVALQLPKKIEEYFDWCRNHAAEIEYSVDRIDAHRELARAYLVDVKAKTKVAAGNDATDEKPALADDE
jgi:hypothetical protein